MKLLSFTLAPSVLHRRRFFILICATPANLYLPASSSNDSYQLRWTTSLGATNYLLEESKDGADFVNVYEGSNLSVNLTEKKDGSYLYRVKAQKSGFADSDWKNGLPLVVMP